MNELRNRPFIRAEYKRHKIKVDLIIEYNALRPPLDMRGNTLDMTEENAKAITRAQAIDLTINPDFSNQIKDGHAVRVVDVKIEKVTDLEV